MIKLLHGDYVLGTKYKDGSPYDAWGVGFYDKEKGFFSREKAFVIDFSNMII